MMEVTQTVEILLNSWDDNSTTNIPPTKQLWLVVFHPWCTGVLLQICLSNLVKKFLYRYQLSNYPKMITWCINYIFWKSKFFSDQTGRHGNHFKYDFDNDLWRKPCFAIFHNMHQILSPTLADCKIVSQWDINPPKFCAILLQRIWVIKIFLFLWISIMLAITSTPTHPPQKTKTTTTTKKKTE